MAVKRRTIWMSDEDWTKTREQAEAQKVSPSALIRAAVLGGPYPGRVATYGLLLRTEADHARRVRPLSDDDSHALFPPEVVRPFAEFRPAPKPGKGK